MPRRISHVRAWWVDTAEPSKEHGAGSLEERAVLARRGHPLRRASEEVCGLRGQHLVAYPQGALRAPSFDRGVSQRGVEGVGDSACR